MMENSKPAWKLGVELELLAPRGQTRHGFAAALASHIGGVVRTEFALHKQLVIQEAAQTMPVLQPAFVVVDKHGHEFVRCLDDLSIQADLNKEAPPEPGWYQLLSDDVRLLSLVRHNTRYDPDPMKTLMPIAKLFATEPVQVDAGLIKVVDECGYPVVMAAPHPGERQRVCEVVTAPMLDNRQQCLQHILHAANVLGFTSATESATHLHFDATRLCSAKAFRRLVLGFAGQEEKLRQRFLRNPNSRLVGHMSEELIALVKRPDFGELTWSAVSLLVNELSLHKYCDFNVLPMFSRVLDERTFEIRMLPGILQPQKLFQAIGFFESMLHQFITHDGVDL